MRRVFVHAFAAGNLGDDMMMRILCQRYPDIKFCLFADESYKSRFRDIKNIKIYSSTDSLVIRIDRLLNQLKGTEMGFWKLLIKTSIATVHIGGSVFTQHEDNYADAIHLDSELCRLSKRMYVVGANFGPYVNEQYYKDYQKLFQSYTDICFRDQYSYRLFQNLPNVRYAPDVVFNYKQAKLQNEKKQVLISVIDMENRGGKYSICQYTEVYERFLLGMSREFLKRDYHVVFMSFCAIQEDGKAIERLRSQMSENTEVCYYDQNIEECVQKFFESEIIVGTRFHSIILGWLAEKKVLPIVYDNKTVRTLEDNEIKEYITLDMLGSITEEEIADWTERLIKSRPMDVSAIRAASDKQFEGLDKLLKQ